MRWIPTLVVLAGLALPAGAPAEAPSAATLADERRCGDMGARAPDYYDVRARNVSCRRARRVVLEWADSFSNAFDAIDVDEFACDGRRSKRRIDGTRTFLIRCADDARVIRWWIRPFH